MINQIKIESLAYIKNLLSSDKGEFKYYCLDELFFLKKLGLKLSLLEVQDDVYKLIKSEINGDNQISIISELGTLKVISNKKGRSKNDKINNIVIKEFILWKILNKLNKLTYNELNLKINNNNESISIIKSNQIIDELKNLEYLQKQNYIYLYIKSCFILNKSKDLELSDFNKNTEKIKKMIASKEKEFELLKKSTISKDLDKKESLELIISNLKNLYIKNHYKDKLTYFYSDEDLINKILNYKNNEESDKEIFYRGQAESSWYLKSGISRNSNFTAYEDELFLDILTLKPNEFSKDKTVYEKLITMQHFGIPTRLLDLTKNPLIGLYFACESQNNKDGAFYIFKESRENILNFSSPQLECFKKLVKNPFNQNCKNCDDILKSKTNCKSEKKVIENPYFIKGIANNNRINNQSGSFIFTGVTKEKKIIDKLDDLIEEVFIIDSSIKTKILKKLKYLNIHSGTVYPDLSNMALYLKTEIEERKISEINNNSSISIFQKKEEDIKNFILDLKNNNDIIFYANRNNCEDFEKYFIKNFSKKIITYKNFKSIVSKKETKEELFTFISSKIFNKINKID